MTPIAAISLSNELKRDENIKLKALLASLSFHILLLALAFSLLPQVLKTPLEEASSISISLADYVPSPNVLQKTEPTSSKEVLPEEKQTISKTQAKTQPKKIDTKKMQTPQQAPLTEEKVLSAEAFTPPVSNETSTQNSDTKLIDSPQKVLSDKPNELPSPSESSSQITPTTLGLIRAMIQNALIYPTMAKRLKIEGVVVVSFVLTSNGLVESATIITKSGSNSLDTKALDTVLALSGEYPTVNKTVQLQIPIAFSLKKS
ncbi:MAG TPA: hypothetical protein CFH84_04490 [Sulfurimonas sp. UBA12504]|nr:MAG TPA: hypothetical protein CFH84_04490 [Sulfurimonas sp. UBA12504]